MRWQRSSLNYILIVDTVKRIPRIRKKKNNRKRQTMGDDRYDEGLTGRAIQRCSGA